MGNPIFHSQYTAQQIEDSIGKTPVVNYNTRTWLIWDIETSQYVDSGVSVDTDIMIDDTLSIPNAAADAAEVGRRTSALLEEGYIFPAIEQGSLGMDDGVITKYTNAKRLRLSSTLSNGIFEISCDVGYRYLLWVTGASAGYGASTISGPCTVSFDTNNTFSITIGRVDGGDISVEEGRHLHIKQRTDFGTPNEIEFGGAVRLADLNAPEASYTYKPSEVFKVPEGGFSVSVPFEVETENKKLWNVSFYKMTESGLLELNTDYSYGYMVGTKTVNTSMTVFYPYEANTYAQVCATDPANTTVTLYDRREGGRPLTLAPMAIRSVAGATTKPLRYQPSFKVYASGAYTAPQSIYGTIIRLDDADGICCSQKYALSAWFYDGTTDEVTGQLVPVDAVYSTPSPSVAVGGPTHIDFRGRNAVFAVVGIRCAVRSSGTTAADRDTETMGILAQEDDAMDNVRVLWKNHVIITHRNELPLVLGENINWLKKLRHNILQHHYRGPWTAKQTVFHAAQDATLGFYAGNNYANNLLAMVTMDSYASTLKHLYSRAYVGEWYPYDLDPDTHTVKKPDSVTGSGYGWICANLPETMCGFKWFATATNFYKIPDYNGFEIVENIDLHTDIDQLRPGDWLWGQSMEEKTIVEDGVEKTVYRYDYHVLLTTDIIYVNGTPFAVEFLESYPPMVRHRFLCLDPLMMQITDDFGSEDDVTYYNLIARPNPRDLRRIEDIWDTSVTAWTPGKVAVDRGHNSVYTTGNAYLYATVYDNELEEFTVVRNGSTIATVTINDNYITLYGSTHRTVDLIDLVSAPGNGPGAYGILVNNVLQDSFLVAEIPTVNVSWPANQAPVQEVVVNTGATRDANGRVIDPTTGYEIVNLIAHYKPSVDGDYPIPSTSEDVEYVYNEETGQWEYVVVPGGGVSPTDDPMAQSLRFLLSIRAEDLVDSGSGCVGKFAYATRFTVGEFEADFFLNWIEVQYITPNGGIVLGQDKDKRWCNSDGIVQKTMPI